MIEELMRRQIDTDVSPDADQLLSTGQAARMASVTPETISFCGITHSKAR